MGRTNQMSMLGNIGQPSRPSVPDGRVVQAALDLLVALGNGNPEARAYLEKMRSSGSHNQKLLDAIAEQHSALSTLEQSTEQRKRELDEQEKGIDIKIAKMDAIMTAVNYPQD